MGIDTLARPDVEKEAVQYVDREASSRSDLSGEVLEWTVEEETAIRHKIDWHTVPMVTILYMLCFLDRINIGNARIAGIVEDLKLKGDEFNWALSIFYIVYLTVEIPSNILLKRIGGKFYLPALVIGFGLVSLFTTFVTNFKGLMVARAFLGIFEGGVFPGMAFYLSSFYKREELLFRVGIYVSSASMAGAFGGLLATGLSKIPPWGTSSFIIKTWRNIFFFEGLITIIIGFSAPYFLPTNPAKAHFLNDREQKIAAERLLRESRADPNAKVTSQDVKRAIFTIHNYTCALGFFLINITVQGLSVFMPLILSDLKWTATKAQLLTVPPYVCACLIAVFIAYVSDKTKLRGVYLATFSLLAIIGFSILRFETSANIRYMAVFFVTMGAFPGGPGFLSWAMNNSAGPSVRAVTSAYVVTLGTIGGIVATWTYRKVDSPRYFTGHTINLAGQMAVGLLATFGIVYCWWENKQRAQGKRNHRLEGLTEEEQNRLGSLHPSFRYIL